MHLRLSLSMTRRVGRQSLLSRLQNSTAGFYYPVETDRMWQDTAATTPVDADGDPIGRHDDALFSNNATQDTSADRPLWDETENAWQLDGVTDHIVVPDPSAVGANATLGMNVKTSDTTFILASEEGQFAPSTLIASSETTSPGGDIYVDGVQLFNPTRADFLAVINDGSWHHVADRALDATAYADGLRIGSIGAGSGGFLEGFLSDPYLTDITDSVQLDAIADAAMSERGITTLRNKTAEAVTQEATDGSLYTGGVTYMWQDTAGETQTEDDDDPVGLILPNHELVVTDGSPRTLSGLGDEAITNGGFDTDLTGWVDVNSHWAVSGGKAVHAFTSDFNMLLQDISGTISPGDTVLISFDVSNYSGTSGLRVQFRDAAQNPLDPSAWSDNTGTNPSITENGSYAGYFVVPQDAVFIAFARNVLGLSATFEIDNVSIKKVPGTPFLQATSGDRPTFDAATGLLDFDGVSEHLTADLTGIGARTSLYVTYLINTTDTDFGVLAGSAGTSYVGYAKDADANATISALAGTPTYWLDTALASWASRDAVHTAVADGSLHLVEVIFDASNAAWDTLHFGRYGSVYTDGLALPLYLGPAPGVLERNILRKYWKQQFPDLSY
jgi:hypothetical protein